MLATVAQLAAAWLLGSWWPHTALHMHHGMNPDALVLLEVGFHPGSIVAAALLLWAVLPAVHHRPGHPHRTSDTRQMKAQRGRRLPRHA